MDRDRSGGEVSLPHVGIGIVVAALSGLFARFFLFYPLLGPTDGRAASLVLMFFLLGYLAFPVAPRGQAPPPWASWLRLRSGLVFVVMAILTIVLPDRL
ncbi:MAG TPA: hypothetical protein VLB12_08790 [Gemmatimonadales bacterium]|nr:hypothetical protein [Gemmatimonadales bacterium]